MIAATFWSLLGPAIELAEKSGVYGKNGEYAFVPVAGGFLLGSIFVFATDKIISYLGINSSNMMIGKWPWHKLLYSLCLSLCDKTKSKSDKNLKTKNVLPETNLIKLQLLHTQTRTKLILQWMMPKMLKIVKS